jgi:CHAT domain-containing protein
VGEGVESLARAFLYSGARAVIASLWQVSDWAAAETMEAFYAGSLEQGLAPARALREAKLALRRSRALRGTGIVTSGRVSSTLESGHPFFWAPFIHVGHGHP